MNDKPEVMNVYRTLEEKIAINPNSLRQTVQNLVLLHHIRGLVLGRGGG